jgi:hypothetical protein
MSEEVTHASLVRGLAAEMFRGALWATIATVALGAVVSTIWVGVPGLLGALVGGVVICVSSLSTLWLMRKTAALEVHFVMAAALGGFMLKMIILLGVMVLLRDVSWLHPKALAFTMIATIIVTAAMEARASKRMKMPSVIPAAEPS